MILLDFRFNAITRIQVKPGHGPLPPNMDAFSQKIPSPSPHNQNRSGHSQCCHKLLCSIAERTSNLIFPGKAIGVQSEFLPHERQSLISSLILQSIPPRSQTHYRKMIPHSLYMAVFICWICSFVCSAGFH